MVHSLSAACKIDLVVKILVCVEGHAELPPSWHYVEELDVLPTCAGHGEAKPLADEPGERLPVGAPVPGHLDPPRVIALDPGGGHGPAASEVLDIHEQEVVVAGHAEAHAAVAPALDLLVLHRDDAAAVDADVLPRRLRHVEVGQPRAAPPAFGQRVVGWAQVGGRHGDPCARLAVLAARA